MAFQIDTISVDGKVDAQEGQSDLIITGSKFSGENLGFGDTVYVTLNGKTYTGVVEGGNYDNHWQITVPHIRGHHGGVAMLVIADGIINGDRVDGDRLVRCARRGVILLMAG